MSIYSGFATRGSEQTYDDYVDSVLYILQKRILKFYKGETTDEDKFADMLIKLHTKIKAMETHKYLQPKNSQTIEELAMYLKNKQLKQASCKKNKELSEKDSIHTSELNNKYVKIHSQIPPKKQKPPSNSKQFTQDFEELEIPKFKQSRPQTKFRKRHSNHLVPHQPNNRIILQQGLTMGLDTHKSRKKIKNKNKNYSRNHINSMHENKNKNQVTFNGGMKGETLQNMESFIEDRNISTEEKKKESGDVRELIKNYLNKTKKGYNKIYNRHGHDIENIFKEMQGKL